MQNVIQESPENSLLCRKAGALLRLAETDDVYSTATEFSMSMYMIRTLISQYEDKGVQYAIGIGKYRSVVQMSVSDKVAIRDLLNSEDSRTSRAAKILLMRDKGLSTTDISRELEYQPLVCITGVIDIIQKDCLV